MNPEQLLDLAAKAIGNRPIDQVGPWQICYLDGQIQCVSINSMNKPEIIFLTVSDSDVRNGLTNSQWNKLGTAMTRFWRQKKL